MIFAMLRVMTLSLLRDRGALVLAFVLPAAIFLILASIFAATASDKLQLKVAFGAGSSTPSTQAFEKALRSDPALHVSPSLANRDDVATRVERGQADVGVFIGGRLEDVDAPPVTVLVEPSKTMAGAILAGRIQALVQTKLPDLALLRTASTFESVVGALTPEQFARLSATVEALAHQGDGDTTSDRSSGNLIKTISVGSSVGSNASITYYAGAVAIMFLLFSALQSAATLIEERNSGILDRIAVGPAGTDAVVLGKFLFVTIQGLVQVAVIFAVAALVYHIDLTQQIGLWLLTSIAASLGAAGLALAVASACTTRHQAQTISTFVVLICSAIGGSMVPRFMMPQWLQDLGHYTPNTWVIEAYYGTLWRGEGLSDILPEIFCLLAMAAVGTLVALMLARRRLQF
ncbi:ABC transporter permease [Rhizobium sp. NTR19]|uniref:ABC transporter permease n=1 Tax=Neorhizobium turbinariae TaxID=2937795 RepID=A0ABT0IPM4_9HYPH|nr:ABC transporter permease [Neorhizobium turbinariae]MCK8779797.1 ABC transporter permease [Neorhizobium turbinariae]